MWENRPRERERDIQYQWENYQPKRQQKKLLEKKLGIREKLQMRNLFSTFK